MTRFHVYRALYLLTLLLFAFTFFVPTVFAQTVKIEGLIKAMSR